MKIKVHLSPAHQHELIQCKNNKCGASYILHGIIMGEEDNEIGVYAQIDSYYCPYCGIKQTTINTEVKNDR